MPDRSRARGFARRSARLLRSKMHTDVHERLIDLRDSISNLHRDVLGLHGQLEQVRLRLDSIQTDARRTADVTRLTYDEEPANRRRLHELRRSGEYELAFTEPEPLVSFLVPTYNSFATLRDVALPSILGQSYSNLEIVVVGDCAPPETEAAIAEIGDPRVTYFNRTIRGPYPEDESKRWFVIGTPPFNDALAVARGRWIAVLGDDDAIRPNHTEDLLAAAQAKRYEHCYGLQLVNFTEGDPLTVGQFPPTHGQWGLQAALYHAGLRFFEAELSDAIYDEPSDWSKCRRMLRAGVRFGMIDEIVVDKHETRRRNAREWKEGKLPTVD
ncbi:MAG: hypothetical protein QOI84_1934 [Solirubrobacterales bacterium]|nr:hypothetical protein [Solirubrobacterales bacterium]